MVTPPLFIAKLRYLHIAPRKVRLIANTLRGLTTQEAEAQLIARTQRSALPLIKLIKSAMANALAKNIGSKNSWIIHEIRVDQGPVLERFLPRAQGRATPLQKKMSHVTVMLREGKAREERFVIAPRETKQKQTVADKKAARAARGQKPAADETALKAKTSEKGFLRKVFTRKSV